MGIQGSVGGPYVWHIVVVATEKYYIPQTLAHDGLCLEHAFPVSPLSRCFIISQISTSKILLSFSFS